MARTLRFARARLFAVLAISAALLIPCFWHRHLEAGDLASHTYNAWLAGLISSGEAPGLSIAPQRTNILVDVALERLGGVVGFEVAEKIVASACVLIFFWGAFALIGAASRKPPWFLLPAIAMVAYGWTFQMGFLNYYLSLGVGFFAVALSWRGRGIDWLISLMLAGVALMAHPMGLFFVVAVAGYTKVAVLGRGSYRWSVFIFALLGVLAVHFYVVRNFRAQYWDTSFFYAMSGADQLVLFGSRYATLAGLAALFGSWCFLWEWHGKKGTAESWECRTALEVWVIFVFAAALVPELIQLPQYASPVGFLISRLTSVTAVMGLCVLASVKPQRWHGVGFSAIAAAFFLLLFLDTGTLNNMEIQADDLVRGLPFGQRVIVRIETPSEWRVRFVGHMVDRACIGRCFAFSNYEAASGQFRIRATAGNGIVSNSPDDVAAMEAGTYVVGRQDLPIELVHQCDEKDWTRLCRRELSEGENMRSAERCSMTQEGLQLTAFAYLVVTKGCEPIQFSADSFGMNAALPELRSAVMIVVEASWKDAVGGIHELQARMEDKSAGGACLRLKAPVEVGARMQVRWRFDQFSGLVKYCRSEGGEFVVGMQRDKGAMVARAGNQPAVREKDTDRPDKPVASKSEVGEVPPQREIERRESKRLAQKLPATRSEIPVREVNADAAMQTAEERALDTVERGLKTWLLASEEKLRRDVEMTDREGKERNEWSGERKPMKRKWLDLTPWNHKQEGPSVGGNGNNQAGAAPNRRGETAPGSLASAERMNPDAEESCDASFPADLLGMEEVYLAAGVMQPRGRGVHKVTEMLRSAHMRGMSEEMKRAAVLMALETAGITVYQIQRDAKARQDALDAYEAEQKKHAETQWARKEEENSKLQADLERVHAQYTARMARNLKTIALEQTVLRNWQTLKQQELLKISEAVDICVKPVVDLATSVQAVPVTEKAHAAAAGAAGVGGIKPS